MVRHDFVFKIIVIGDSGVGKTSFVTRFVDDEFHSSFISTIGIDFKIKTIQLNNHIIKLQVWDTAGQERFRTITTAYYRGAMGIILVYDVTNFKSFDDIKVWIDSISKNNDDTNIVKMLIGNKIDCRKGTSDDVISYENGKELAEKYNMLFFETSSKDNININDAMMAISNKIYEKYENVVSKQNTYTNNPSLPLRMPHAKTKKSFCMII